MADLVLPLRAPLRHLPGRAGKELFCSGASFRVIPDTGFLFGLWSQKGMWPVTGQWLVCLCQPGRAGLRPCVSGGGFCGVRSWQPDLPVEAQKAPP